MYCSKKLSVGETAKLDRGIKIEKINLEKSHQCDICNKAFQRGSLMLY